MGSFNDSRGEAGDEVIKQLGWGDEKEQVREMDADLWDYIREANFGTIWARPGLSLRERELICMSILIAIGAPGIAIHFKYGHKLGFTDEEMREIIMQTIPYAGLPRALSAMAAFHRIKAGEVPKL